MEQVLGRGKGGKIHTALGLPKCDGYQDGKGYNVNFLNLARSLFYNELCEDADETEHIKRFVSVKSEKDHAMGVSSYVSHLGLYVAVQLRGASLRAHASCIKPSPLASAHALFVFQCSRHATPNTRGSALRFGPARPMAPQDAA